MPILCCPKCGHTEFLNVYGKWRVHCTDCGARFLFCAPGQNQPPFLHKPAIDCPHCGHHEENIAAPAEKGFWIICPACAKRFAMP